MVPVPPRQPTDFTAVSTPTIGEGPLRGGQRSAVQGIVDHVRTAHLATGEQAIRVLMLTAPTGTGKSRIVRGVYDQLREQQGPAAYWPELPADQAVRNRKQLGPELDSFSWPRDAIPTFAWWQLHCATLNSQRPADVLSSLTEQLKVHVVPLSIALKREQGATKSFLKQALSNGQKAVRDLLQDELDNQTEAFITSLIPLPGMQAALGLVAAVGRAAELERQQRQDLARETNTGEQARDDIQAKLRALAESIYALSSPNLPAVVAVEDVHLLSEDGLVFLTRLLELGHNDPDHPVLIVTTGWPERSSPLLQPREAAAVTVDIPELDESDLAAIVQDAAPRTSLEVARHVARSGENPLAVLSWLGKPRVQAEIIQASGELTSRALQRYEATLHATADELYADRWDELPDNVRQALMLAVLTQSRSQPGAGSVRYVPAVVAHPLDEPERSDISKGLRLAVDAAGWARQRTDVHLTDDPAATRCIRRQMDHDLRLTEQDQEQYLDRSLLGAVEFLRAELNLADRDLTPRGLPSEAVRVEAARLAAAELPDDGTGRALTVAYALALEDFHTGAQASGLDRLRTALCGATGPRSEPRLRPAACALFASLASELNDGRVLAEAEGMLQAASAEPGLSLRDQQVLGDLQVSLRLQSGQPVDGATLPLPDSPVDAVLALMDRAQLAYRGGNRALAVQFAGDANDRAQALPAEPALQIEAGQLYLAVVGHDQAASRMLPLVEGLLATATELYSAQDHRTLDLQRQLLRWELKDKPSTKLAASFDDLVADVQRLVGRYAPMTITTRYQQAQAWSRSAEPDRGLQLIDALIEEVEAVYGADHRLAVEVRWYKKYQIEPYVFRPVPVPEGYLVRATPDGQSWSRSVVWDDDTLARLDELYAP